MAAKITMWLGDINWRPLFGSQPKWTKPILTEPSRTDCIIDAALSQLICLPNAFEKMPINWKCFQPDMYVFSYTYSPLTPIPMLFFWIKTLINHCDVWGLGQQSQFNWWQDETEATTKTSGRTNRRPSYICDPSSWGFPRMQRLVWFAWLIWQITWKTLCPV